MIDEDPRERRSMLSSAQVDEQSVLEMQLEDAM